MAADPGIGIKIRLRRQEMGLTQDELAEKIPKAGGRPGHIHRTTIANWEGGKHFPKRYQGKLERVLGISLTSQDRQRPSIPLGLRRYVAALDPADREWVLEELRMITEPSEDPAADDPGDEREEL